MSWHSIVDYDPVHMHAKPHTRTLSINEDIRGGHNVPPPREYDAKKRLVVIGLRVRLRPVVPLLVEFQPKFQLNLKSNPLRQ